MKKILILGMVDSVHTARWVERIADTDLEIHIFPSRTHRRIHPKLIKLAEENSQIKLLHTFPNSHLSPYLDYFYRKLKYVRFNFVNMSLKKLLERNHYSHIHALEFQHAGYLLLEVRSAIPSTSRVICTNWGSDIYYFRQFEEELVKIKNVLSLADSYSAECVRDYKLAKELGFKGEELPLIPNSFLMDEDIDFKSDASSKSQIIAKCYGEIFGLGKIVIQVMHSFLESNISASVLLYSVTDDLLDAATALKQKFPSRVKVSTIRNPMSTDDIAKEFQRSRIYIGASRSDGISTSFLEAMNYGAFPIQTNTSCAQDWLEQGCSGLAVQPDRESILTALTNSYGDVVGINRAALTNFTVLSRLTNKERLKRISASFYG